VRELSLHLLDIVENSLEAGATRVLVDVAEDTIRNRLTIKVEDNGRGMDQTTLARALDPFFTTRTTRHVGLGLPLLRAAAQRCDGDLRIQSRPGHGTTVAADFRRDHIDRAPLGDIESTLLALVLMVGESDIRYTQRRDKKVFALDTAELREALGSVPLGHPRVRAWVQQYIQEGLESLSEGALCEADSVV